MYKTISKRRNSKDLPSAIDHLDQFSDAIKKKRALICLDYDGTLTPIVEDYTKAFLSDEMRFVLKQLAANVPVAIVSGRDLLFIKDNVGLENLYYAGSHGFESRGPENFHHEVSESAEILPIMDQTEKILHKRLKDIEGVKIERKKYAIAVHFRYVKEEDLLLFKKTVSAIFQDNDMLKRGEGKMIIEFKPNIDWDKGKAVQVLGKQILKEKENPVILYIGDDITDEDAFKVTNYGIVVGHPEDKTYADYYLENVDEVKRFLQRLID